MDALFTGRLVSNTESGLAVADARGQITRVMWPFGYSARYVDDHLELLDDDGSVVAAEGDTVQMGGGSGNAGLFYACDGSVRRV
jgi:hypothetical protein